MGSWGKAVGSCCLYYPHCMYILATIHPHCMYILATIHPNCMYILATIHLPTVATVVQGNQATV